MPLLVFVTAFERELRHDVSNMSNFPFLSCDGKSTNHGWVLHPSPFFAKVFSFWYLTQFVWTGNDAADLFLIPICYERTAGTSILQETVGPGNGKCDLESIDEAGTWYMVGTCGNQYLVQVNFLLPSSTSGGYTYRLYPKTSLATKCNDTIKLHCRDVCSWSTVRRSVKMNRSYQWLLSAPDSLEGTKTYSAAEWWSQVSEVPWNQWLINGLKIRATFSNVWMHFLKTNFPIRKST